MKILLYIIRRKVFKYKYIPIIYQIRKNELYIYMSITFYHLLI